MILRDFAASAAIGFPLAAFTLFFTTFLAVLVVVARRSARSYRDVAALPLEDEGEIR